MAMDAGITNSKTLPFIIAKAVAGAMGVAGQLDSEALDDELREQFGVAVEVAAATPVVEDTDAPPAEDAEEDEEEEDAS